MKKYCCFISLLVWENLSQISHGLAVPQRHSIGSIGKRSPSIRQFVSSNVNNLYPTTVSIATTTRTRIQSNGSRYAPRTRHFSSSSSSSTFRDKLQRNFSTLMTGSNPKRPEWAMEWMPTWLLSMRPLAQFFVGLFLYIFHMVVLTQNSIPFPFQIIPNNKGYFQSIGMDSLAGIVTLGVYQYFQRYHQQQQQQKRTESTDTDTEDTSGTLVVPNLLKTPHVRDTPWKGIYQSKYSRFSSFLACCALFQAYMWTGRLSLWWNDTFYALANYYPMTIAMHRSLCVLMGHLSWVALGTAVLRLIPRPQPYHTKWYASSKTTQWLWWTIGGYYVSSLVFNIADFINQLVLPVAILEQASESVVSQLIQPEYNDRLASLVGFIAPCLTAPWWEEVLYRGFLLPSLVLQMNYKWAVLWSGVIFSVHHLSPTACIPLAILGWTWSILYTKSGNLFTTILVHAMWNSRVFLGSWLGL